MKFFRKKEVLIPTGQVFFLLLLLIGGLFYGVISHLYPFLAQHHPLPNAEIIIIEGWLPDAELKEAARDIQPEQIVVATGGPVKFGGSLLREKTYAEVTAARLRLFIMADEKILCAPAPDVQCDRTYASALAARDALKQRGLFGKSCNVYSMGAHSRRSFYLYKQAFGTDYPIGVVSLESQEADLRHWWRSSLAFKQVLGELTSWIYTLFSSYKYA
ncbi:MAG: hypothetical protein WCG03_05180 [Kiritimatiellales bacterium]